MIKKVNFYVFLVIVTFFSYSCNNFFQGSFLKQDIEDKIALANAEYFNVEFQISNSNAGQITPSGVKKIRKNEIFEINVTLNNNYVLSELCVYEKKNGLLINNNDDIVILNEESTNSNGIYSYKITAKAVSDENELLILIKSINSKDETPPEILNSYPYEYTIETDSGGNYKVSDIKFTFYVLEEESNIIPIAYIDVFDTYQNNSLLKKQKYTTSFEANYINLPLQLDYVGFGIYKATCYLDLREIEEIPENEFFITEILVCNNSDYCRASGLYSKLRINNQIHKKTLSESILVLSSFSTDSEYTFNECSFDAEDMSEITAENYKYYLNFLNIDDRYLKVTQNVLPPVILRQAGLKNKTDDADSNIEIKPEQIFWGYTQNKDDIDKIKFNSITIEPYSHKYLFTFMADPIEIDIKPTDIHKDTYVVIKSNLMFNNQEINVITIPSCPDFVYHQKNDEISTIAINNISDEKVIDNIIYVKQKEQADYISYIFDSNTINVVNLENTIYLQSCKKVNIDELNYDIDKNYYILSPILSKNLYADKSPDSNVIEFSNESSIKVEALRDEDSSYHKISINVDPEVYKQFEAVVANVNGSLTQKLVLNNDNTVSFNVSSKLFYESNGIEVIDKSYVYTDEILTNEEFTKRCDLQFSLIGIKDDICYETEFVIPSTNPDVKDNIPPCIPTDYVYDSIGQNIVLTKYFYDYGKGIVNSHFHGSQLKVNVHYEGKNVAYSKDMYIYIWNAEHLKIPVYFLNKGLYDITISVEDEAYQRGSSTISDFKADRRGWAPSLSYKNDGVTVGYSITSYSNIAPTTTYLLEYFDTENSSWIPFGPVSTEWTRKKGTNEYITTPYEITESDVLIRGFIHDEYIGEPYYLIYSKTPNKKSSIDYSIMEHSILIYTGQPVFVHTIVNDEDFDFYSAWDWDKYAGISSKQNDPIPGAQAQLHNDELNPVFITGDYSQIPYRYEVPWDDKALYSRNYKAIVVYDGTTKKVFKLDSNLKKIIDEYY